MISRFLAMVKDLAFQSPLFSPICEKAVNPSIMFSPADVISL